MYSPPHHEGELRPLNDAGGVLAIRARVSKAAFGDRLISNHLRGLVAEAIVAAALEPVWTWCSADWAGWDFERADGLKLEVKQSASRQTWAPDGGSETACRFDIRARTGSYIGSQWRAKHGRIADVYVFAHHFEVAASADHCDPTQWRFFAVAERCLPQTKTIGLRGVQKLADPCSFTGLADAVDDCTSRIVIEPTAYEV